MSAPVVTAWRMLIVSTRRTMGRRRRTVLLVRMAADARWIVVVSMGWRMRRGVSGMRMKVTSGWTTGLWWRRWIIYLYAHGWWRARRWSYVRRR
jgi:hypothetical protein